MAGTIPHITVCVCTYRRPRLLRELIEGVRDQTTNNRFTHGIRIVDNDINTSARQVVEQLQAQTAMQIEYLHEPRQNISLARNKAVTSVQGELVALIDDDEIPARDWLLNHFQAIETSGADGVLGPVLPRFPRNCPAWLEASGLCRRPEHATGYVLNHSQTRTGNCLLKAGLFRAYPAPFKSEYGLSGGEDTDFFMRQMAEGRRFIWCQEAPVYEEVPDSRWHLSYYVRRQFRGGALDGEREKDAKRFARCALLAGAHFIRAALLVPFGKRKCAKPLASMANHAGYVFASLGLRFDRHRAEIRGPTATSDAHATRALVAKRKGIPQSRV